MMGGVLGPFSDPITTTNALFIVTGGAAGVTAKLYGPAPVAEGVNPTQAFKIATSGWIGDERSIWASNPVTTHDGHGAGRIKPKLVPFRYWVIPCCPALVLALISSLATIFIGFVHTRVPMLASFAPTAGLLNPTVCPNKLKGIKMAVIK